jgi:shikimate kinase
MARLVLVGLPGVGKTTVARALAREWGCGVFDTDDLLSQAVGRSAPEYLRQEGLVAFRNAELAALEVALNADGVVATGGGVVTTFAARELLRAQVTLWLDCDDDVLRSRLGGVDRPLIGEDVGAALAQLRRERATLYAEVARVRIDASGQLVDVTKRARDAASAVQP